MNLFQANTIKTIAGLALSAGLAFSQTPIRDVENKDHFPLQLSIANTAMGAGVTSFSSPFLGVPPSRRYVIEHISVTCTFAPGSDDKLAEALLTIFDANNISHEYQLAINQNSNQSPKQFAATISVVSEAIRTYHDGGPNGTSAPGLVLHFSLTGIQKQAFCSAEVSGYSVAKTIPGSLAP